MINPLQRAANVEPSKHVELSASAPVALNLDSPSAYGAPASSVLKAEGPSCASSVAKAQKIE